MLLHLLRICSFILWWLQQLLLLSFTATMMTQGASHTNPKKRPLPRSSNSTFARGRDATSEDIARLIAGTDDDGVPLVLVYGGWALWTW